MDFLSLFSIFVLSVFVGFYVVWGVTPALHSPLLAVTNAISSVIIVGAIIAGLAGNIDNVSYSKSIIHKDYLEQFGLNVFNLTEKCRNDNLSLSYSGGTQ